jgi:hypothetical protein
MLQRVMYPSWLAVSAAPSLLFLVRVSPFVQLRAVSAGHDPPADAKWVASIQARLHLAVLGTEFLGRVLGVELLSAATTKSSVFWM